MDRLSLYLCLHLFPFSSGGSFTFDLQSTGSRVFVCMCLQALKDSHISLVLRAYVCLRESILENRSSKHLIYLSEVDLYTHFSFTVSPSGGNSKSPRLSYTQTLTVL